MRPDGVILRTEALAAGLSPDEIDRRLRRGDWVRLHYGVYHDTVAALTPLARARARAAVRAVDLRETAASHATAARVLGIDIVREPPGADVTVGRDGRRERRRTPLRVHARKFCEDDVVMVDGVRVTSPVRTVRDLMFDADRLTAIWAAEHALRLGLVTELELTVALSESAHHPGSRRARERFVLVDARSESPLETGVRLVMLDGKLPRPALQIPVTDAAGKVVHRIDLGYEWARLGIETDGRSVHDTVSAVYADRSRANTLQAQGWRLLRFTWHDMVAAPGYIVTAVAAALKPAG